jgi:hypothetical protein
LVRIHSFCEGSVLSESGMPDPTGDVYTAGTELGLSNLGSRVVGSRGVLRGTEPALAGSLVE